MTNSHSKIKVPQVNFLKITDNQRKLMSIVHIASKYFEQKEQLIIWVQNNEAARYVDQLLWKYSEESFLAHAYSDSQTNEKIVISTKTENLNHAKVLLNLRPESVLDEKFQSIYELFDETNEEKIKNSQKKLQEYRQAGFQIIENFK